MKSVGKKVHSAGQHQKMTALPCQKAKMYENGPIFK